MTHFRPVGEVLTAQPGSPFQNQPGEVVFLTKLQETSKGQENGRTGAARRGPRRFGVALLVVYEFVVFRCVVFGSVVFSSVVFDSVAWCTAIKVYGIVSAVCGVRLYGVRL